MVRPCGRILIVKRTKYHDHFIWPFRLKGWRRIVLLFNFFIPGAVQADANLNPIAITLTTHHSTFTLALALALTLTLTLCRRTLALAP